MKKILTVLLLILGTNIYPSTTAAATDSKSVLIDNKNAYKSMLSVITYDKQGNILHSGYGFFTSKEGDGVAAFSLFKEACSADVIDYKGRKTRVHRILGASSTYDLVTFSTADNEKVDYLPLPVSSSLDKGSNAGLVLYSGKKKSAPLTVHIESADNFEAYKYFTISADNVEKHMGCPLINGNGEVVAVVQKNVGEKAKNACAIDARFLNELNITCAHLLDKDLKEIYIPKGIPTEEKEAMNYLYMLGYRDTTAYEYAIGDFISAYPENAEGYNSRAAFYAFVKKYQQAEADFQTALQLIRKKKSDYPADEVYNNISKAIYFKVVQAPETEYSSWTMDKAAEAAGKAYEIKASPYYLLQQANCYMAQKNYKKAYGNYCTINGKAAENATEWSPRAQAETWIMAANAFNLGMSSKEFGNTRNDSLHLAALYDSAIVALPEPYQTSDANYFIARAQIYESVGEFRKATLDYYEYEKIVGPSRLNDRFYYMREQAEMKCHMYQQALDDIGTAIAYAPENPLYPIEKALIQLQAGLYEEAIATCRESLEKLPENPDCYKIMGIAYGELHDKKKAVEYLNKARQLGDPTTGNFIKKYQ